MHVNSAQGTAQAVEDGGILGTFREDRMEISASGFLLICKAL